MKRAFWLWLLCLWTLGGPVCARTLPIHFTTTVSPTPVHPGEVVSVTVRTTVDAGWHVYSVVPTPNGPAASDIVSLGAWAAVGPTTEDVPVRKLDSNFGAVVAFHEGTATFMRAFRVPPSGGVPTALTLHYQTCNDKICLPPTDVSLPVAVAVAAGPVRAAYAQASPALPGAVRVGAHGNAPPSGQGAADVKQGGALEGGGASPAPTGLLLFLLAAAGAGLLAIATPCVFPLIPITLTNFVKQADGSQAKLVRLSVGYALGIVALYVALGAGVAALGGRANNVAANPWVNLAEFALFVVFAFSFFEAITLQLPANLGALQQSARKHGGTAGLALLGVTFVLGSFTCTAPFVGTLLVSAANGQWARPLLGMLAFALAFASPFFVFAVFPQWIGRIPKSGLWLARFKATLGFIELAAALKFLSNADQVWQWKLLTQPVLLAAWALISALAALYLVGLLRFGVVAETEPAGVRVPGQRKAVASLFALAALYCFWGLAGKSLSPYVGAFLPPPGYGGAALADAGDGLPWLSDYPTALAQARAEHKPLLIDFTGYTCTNCRLNEKNVFPRPAVQAQLAHYVRVQLYTDGKGDAGNQRLQEAKFGDVALPLYGVVDPQTEAVVAKTEGVQSVGGFAGFLARAAGTPSLALPLRKGEGAGESHAPADESAPPAPPLSEGGGGEGVPLWAPYTAGAVVDARRAGRPVVIDFTAKWCVNCKEIERDVFQDPSVAPVLGRDFVTQRADLTQWGSPPSVALQKQYGFGALPTIVFLDKRGAELKALRITGRLPVADFQRRLAAAR